ncbi:TPA: DNA primase [Candidatus Woesearchaeota archaeon]|nr:DNA primase [Candidatus Woesearchaeota archaeon]HII68955.1 DNA primase [Candidatus Woesearchaeota archaeon]
MGKISPVSSKYIIHSNIEIDGIVDRPDVIGAIFGQTEGLLGADLELRELQRSGRIGRIEVNVDTTSGKTQGQIVIPSSLDKAETSIVAAALEIIQRIGPCNAKIKVRNIEDVRVSKRNFVIQRAKELLKSMMDTVMPDSQELADEVSYAVRVMEVVEYGKDRLPAGPAIDESEEIIIVEGRADVVNLLKHGFKNVIAVNGTSIPETIIELTKKKVVTAFVDGDRGGNIIIKELTTVGEVDFVTRAPDGKEVEEITKKEIHKALRSRISAEQAKLELSKESERYNEQGIRRSQQGSANYPRRDPRDNRPPQGGTNYPRREGPRDNGIRDQRRGPPAPSQQKPSKEELAAFKEAIEKLIGTRGAHMLDKNLGVLGKVPVSELQSTINSMPNAIHAVVFDGTIERDMVKAAESADVSYLVAMGSKVKPNETRITLLTVNDL